MKRTDSSDKIIHIVVMGLLAAILLIGQVGMAFLPNIEPVSTLIILYTLTHKKYTFYIIYVLSIFTI